MTEMSFTRDASGHNHLVIADRSGWPTARKLLSTLQASHLNASFIRPRQAARRPWLQCILSHQQIGTRLYIAGTASFIEQVRSDAFSVGFSEAESAVVCTGPPAPHVFCMACYHRFHHPGTSTAHCPNCGQWLELTAHVSDRLQSVMGSVALPSQRHLTSDQRGDHVG